MKKKNVLAAILTATLTAAMLFGCGSENSDTPVTTESQTETELQTQSEASAEPSTEAETESETAETTTAAALIAADQFVEDVKLAIADDIGANESITDVVFEDNDLCVYVDFSEVDPSPLTLEDLALSRTSSITDAILELTQYDNLWNTITVDFGDTGKVINSKANMQDNGYFHYFSSENFVLE